MVITGKTGEQIIVSGDYYCQAHPHTDRYLVKDDTFPKCETNEHETTWMYREKKGKDDNGSEADRTNAGQEKTGNETEEQTPGSNDATTKRRDENEFKLLYARKGFYEARRYKETGEHVQHSLEVLLDTERALTANEIEAAERVYAAKMKTLNERLKELGDYLVEKTGIQNAYVIELGELVKQYEELKEEIMNLDEQLRAALEDLGRAKEQMILKRIGEFEEEINKITEVYQRLEEKHNSKFSQDFDRTAPTEKDKKFYMDYRQHLQDTFDDVAARVSMLERDGLNVPLAKVLKSLGWIAVLTASWFFTQLISCLPEFEIQGNNNLVVFILDGLTTFIRSNDWWVSSIVFVVYGIMIVCVSRRCHHVLGKMHNDKDDKQQDKQKHKKDALEMDTTQEGLIKVSMKADNWYEFWLKIAPFITMVILLVIILAVGNNSPNNSPGNSTVYEDLSNAMALQGVSTLIPLAFAALFSLYIGFMENRTLQNMEKDRPDGGKAKVFRKGRSWEVALSMIGILILMALLLTYVFPVFPDFNKPAIVYAWGFFVSCLCTGMSLAYSYRFIALNKSYSNLIERLDNINIYIGQRFNSYQVYYAKNFVIQLRKAGLYHSFVQMLEQRNNAALRMLGYKEPPADTEQKGDEEVFAKKKERVGRKRKKDLNRTMELMKKWKSLNNVLNYFYKKLFRAKGEKKKLKEEVDELKGNKVHEDELTYFPEKAVRIKELKISIDAKTKEMNNLKTEIDGYYKESATYGSTQKKIDEIQKNIEKTRVVQEQMVTELEQKREERTSLLEAKLICLQEGYTIGMWFSDENETNEKMA